jgi:hypothetical protein
MAKQTRDAVAERVAMLERMVVKHKDFPKLRPGMVTLSELQEYPELLQSREGDAAVIRDIQIAILDGEKIDPLRVWQVGPKFVVLDGHHRLAAFRRLGRGEAIPVTHFEGDLDGALAECLRENIKTRCPTDDKDKRNFAWRMVKLKRPKHSKAVLARMCKVSVETIGRMRRVLDELGEEAGRFAAWVPANRRYVVLVADGRREPDEAEDDWQEEEIAAEARAIASKLRTAFKAQLLKQPQATADGLAIHLDTTAEKVVAFMYQALDADKQASVVTALYGPDDDLKSIGITAEGEPEAA